MEDGCFCGDVDNLLVDACTACIAGDVFGCEFVRAGSCVGASGLWGSSSNVRALESIAHTECGGGGMNKRDKQTMMGNFVGFGIEHVPCILPPIYVASQSGKESGNTATPISTVAFYRRPLSCKG